MENKNALIFGGIIIAGLAFLGILIAATSGKATSAEREVIAIAEELGMDGEKFYEDYKKEDVRARVQEDIDYANSLGVNSTPSVFINDVRSSAISSYDELKGAVEAALLETDVVKVEVFEDLQCPFCAQFFPFPVILEAEFGDAVEVINYHFPLESIHAKAKMYAYFAEAAAEQDMKFEMTRAIFTLESGDEYAVLDSLTDNGSDEGNEDTTTMPVPALGFEDVPEMIVETDPNLEINL